ncbi:hypothetical protein RFI_07633, partial [Reticulomyxa filosa]
MNNYDEAGEHYEIAIQLDPMYEQAHTEFKKFLLHESPFSPKRSKATGGEDVYAKQLHATRCMRYLVRLLWTKQIKEAKEMLAMALRCSETNRFANFLKDPSLFVTFQQNNAHIKRKEPLSHHDVDVQSLLNEVEYLEKEVDNRKQEIASILQSLENYQIQIGQAVQQLSTLGQHPSHDDPHSQCSCSLCLFVSSHGKAQAFFFATLHELEMVQQNMSNQIEHIRSDLEGYEEMPEMTSDWEATRVQRNSNNGHPGSGANATGFTLTASRLKYLRSSLRAANGNSTNPNAKRHSIRSASSARSADSVDNWRHAMETQRRVLAQASQMLGKLHKANNEAITEASVESVQQIEHVLKMLQQTTSIATNARRAYLNDASKNTEQTNEGERAVAKWIVHDFLPQESDSYLAQHGLSNLDGKELTISDADQDDEKQILQHIAKEDSKKQYGIHLFIN